MSKEHFELDHKWVRKTKQFHSKNISALEKKKTNI